jgi:hypothetical protein
VKVDIATGEARERRREERGFNLFELGDPLERTHHLQQSEIASVFGRIETTWLCISTSDFEIVGPLC